MKKILITSALPYVNNVPHLGNIIGCVLSADVFARYCRSKELETLYICGTDEYGTATTVKAKELNVTPQELCDKYHKIHKDIYEWFNISTDIFGRTSTKKHTEITQSIFLDLYKNGMLLEKEIQQPYDKKLNLFLADRYILGECPHCSSKTARADQCDQCGKLLTYPELINPVSKLSNIKPVLKKTKHLFFDLQKLQSKLTNWIAQKEKEGLWSDNTISIARSWLKEGLKQRSITRDLQWGVPVPLKGWENKVLYVWFDAPIGYISITANYTDDYMSWWSGDPEIEHYEFIGKDNVPFHAIIFPATLLGTNKKWTLPHYISATEFLNYETGKFSKTNSVGVFGNDAQSSSIPSDVWRYYLLANRPETSDTTFSWDDFGKRLNNELLANYGNFVNRTLMFLSNNYNGIIPKAKLNEDDIRFLEFQKIKYSKVDYFLRNVKIRSAINEFMSSASDANTYFQKNEPWKLVKEDKDRAASVLYVLANVVKDLAIVSEPFLPTTSKKIFKFLNIEQKKWSEVSKLSLVAGHKIQKPKHLFKPIDNKTLQMLSKKFSGKLKKEYKKINANEIDLEVGKIVKIRNHPNAERLYIEDVEFADGEIRQICSGLVNHFSKDYLLNKTCIIVKNLKTANLRGEKSEGMLLVAESKDGKMELISPSYPPGTKITFEGHNSSPKKEITIEEFFSVELEITDSEIFADKIKLLIHDKPIKLNEIINGKVS